MCAEMEVRRGGGANRRYRLVDVLIRNRCWCYKRRARLDSMTRVNFFKKWRNQNCLGHPSCANILHLLRMAHR